jgi:predicted alpha/beta-hydrolase family hydrolase
MEFHRDLDHVEVRIDGDSSVSALLLSPDRPKACFVFAHGAGAGMTHPFMETAAGGLAERGVATLRYQFPFMEGGRKRPDSPTVAHATVRAAVAAAGRRLPGICLIAGGKSFGGRMTSQAQADAPLQGVHGLVFFGFPLHPVGKPSVGRADHLSTVSVPMLFLQGATDKLAEVELLKSTVKALGAKATLHLVTDADHSFHVPKRLGRTDADVLNEILEGFSAWIETLPSTPTA